MPKKTVVKKKIIKVKKNVIKYKGKNVYYKDRIELGKKLFKTEKKPTILAHRLLNLYKNNQTSRIIYNNQGNFIISRLQDKPLLARPFNIKGISNKNFMDIENYKKMTWKTSYSFSSNNVIELSIDYDCDVFFSAEWENRTGNILLKIAPSEVDDDLILEWVAEYYNKKLENVRISKPWIIRSKYTKQKVKQVNMKLKKVNPIRINNIFNEVLYSNTKIEGECISSYLKELHPKLWTFNEKSRQQKSNEKKLKYLMNLQTTTDILDYSKKNKIRMVVYDIIGNCIARHFPIKGNKDKNYKNISFVAYNNHLYPLKNITLSKVKGKKIHDISFINNVEEMLIKTLNNGVLPSKLYINGKLEVISYTDNDKLFICNEDYNICKHILDTFGLLDQLTPFTNLRNISQIIETLYMNKEHINSFLPNNNQWIKGAYNYTTNLLNCNNLEKLDKITIDKNKCYSWSLRQLDYLLSTNVSACKSGKFNKNMKIKDTWLYIVKPYFSYILLPDTNIYTGEHLIYSKDKGCEFVILEYLETYKHPNIYKQMIDDLYDRLKDYDNGLNIFKKIVNVMIGKFERNYEQSYNRNVEKIVNEEEKLCSNGHFLDLNNGYYINYNYEKTYNLGNRKPIAIQVKDKSRVIIYEMLEKLKLGEKDIIQIKTDSITFINRKDINYKQYINTNLSGWKLEKTQNLIKPKDPYDKPKSFIYKPIHNNNRLYDCYAGCGKSYYFKQEIDYLLRIYSKYDYVILTPSHATLKEYRLKGYNCNVIQKNSYFNKIPLEKYVYIDEIGMVDMSGWYIVYKCYLEGKILTCAGDFKQLLPPIDKRRFNMDNFLDNVFHYRLNMNNNYRNNFTIEYYDSLINSDSDEYLLGEVHKYGCCNYWEADAIICYRNKTRHKYNELMLKRLGHEKINEIGVKIICSCKKSELSKKDIFNKFTYTIQNIDNDIITIEKGLTITLKQLLTHFDLGYARTLYSIQGESLDSYYYPKIDNWFIHSDEAYTIISRLKTNVNISKFIPYEIRDTIEIEN